MTDRDLQCLDLDALQRQMLSDAEEGRWSAFATLLARRDTLLAEVSLQEQHEVYESALRCNTRIIELANRDRDAAASRLHAMSNKNALNRFYESNGGTG